MSFKDYKKNSADELKSLLKESEAAKKQGTGGFEKDPDEWYPQVDKSGSGWHEIRFLPALPYEFDGKKPFVNWIRHEFKTANNGWYLENSLATFKQADPVVQYNSQLWKLSDKENDPSKQQARDQKQKKQYRTNIYVINDTVNPENNGKIKRFKFGPGIFNMIDAVMDPQEIPGEDTPEGYSPFNLFTGANFKIIIYTETKAGRKDRKYDKSKFLARGPLGDEKAMEKIYDELVGNDKKWSLGKYVDPSQFKSYDALSERLNKVLGFDWKTGKALEASGSSPEPQEATNRPTSPKPSQGFQEDAPKASVAKLETKSFESDDEFFNSLKDED